jgi:hypothetical protein
MSSKSNTDMKNNIDFKQRVDQFKWSKGLVALVSLLVLSVTTTYGQLEAGYSMYRFNPQVISPAHSGSTATSEVTLMNRHRGMVILKHLCEAKF